MSLFNRQTVLDSGISSLKINAISFGDIGLGSLDDFGEKVAGAYTGGLVGEDVYGLDLTGEEAEKAAMEANRKAMASEERMFNQSMDLQREMWDWQKTEMEPWKEIGLRNVGRYQEEMDKGFSLSDDEGYQVRLSEGEKGINRAASAGGRYLSGGTLRELGRFNSGLASQEYAAGNARYQQRLDRLGQLGTLGYNATTQLGGVGQNYANTGSQLMTGFGASQSQGYMNQGAIQAQGAGATFNNLMAIGTMVGGGMSGYGAMTNPRGA